MKLRSVILSVILFLAILLEACSRGGVETYKGPDGVTIYFPKQPPVDAYMEVLLIGRLVLDTQGCLRVGEESGRLVLWHHDFTLRIDGDVVEVLNGEGEVVGRVGDAIYMGGGETTAEAVPGLAGGVCGGPYWAVGAIEPLESQPGPDEFLAR